MPYIYRSKMTSTCTIFSNCICFFVFLNNIIAARDRDESTSLNCEEYSICTLYIQYSYEYIGTYCTVHCVQYVTSLIKKEDQDKSITVIAFTLKHNLFFFFVQPKGLKIILGIFLCSFLLRDFHGIQTVLLCFIVFYLFFETFCSILSSFFEM